MINTDRALQEAVEDYAEWVRLFSNVFGHDFQAEAASILSRRPATLEGVAEAARALRASAEVEFEALSGNKVDVQ